MIPVPKQWAGNPRGWEDNGRVISDSPFTVDGTACVGMQHLEKADGSFNDLVDHKQIWTRAMFLEALLIQFLPVNLVLPKNARQSSKTAGHCSGEWLLERRISSHQCCPSEVLTACGGSAPGRELRGERTVSNLQVTGIGHAW